MASFPVTFLSDEPSSDGPQLDRRVFFEPHLGPLHRRMSADGNWLPVMGLIVDQPLDLELTACNRWTVRVGLESVEMCDGVLDGSWHIVVTQRTSQDDETSYSCIKAMYLVGVRQILSVANATFDTKKFMRVIGIEAPSEFIDLTGISDVSGGLASSHCPRLKAALESSARDSGVELLVDDLQAALSAPTNEEAEAAAAFGMCYAALDVIDLTDGSGTASIRDALRRAPDAISPTGSCDCPAGRHDQ